MSPTAAALIVAAIGVLLGMLFQHLLRKQDEHTWVLARAPHLPVRALAVGDDAWLRGTVCVDEPLQCPWFDVPCAAYEYRIEREVQNSSTDAEGNEETESSWETEHHEEEHRDFELSDDDRESTILVRTRNAKNDAWQSLGTEYQTSTLRHRARILELDATVSVLGVKQDDGSFDHQREVPLLITRREPGERLRSSHRSESIKSFFGWLLPFVLGCAAMATWTGQDQHETATRTAMAIGGGLILAMPFWILSTYNQLVRLRQQVRAGFRQVDVDLAVRSGLVPNLIAVIQAACAQEQDLLSKLAKIRATRSAEEATAQEPEAGAAAQAALLLHERYPELTSNSLYRDLHERLWAVEEKLAHSRTFYNDLATEWNTRIQRFPTLLLAHLFSYQSAPTFAYGAATKPGRFA